MNKTERLFDALERPQSYTAEELESMARDPETRELYEALCWLRGRPYASEPISDRELDEEWQRLAGAPPGRWRNFRRWLTCRKVAVAVAMISLSVLAGGIAIGIKKSSSGDVPERVAAGMAAEHVASEPESAACDTVRDVTLPSEIIFRNETLSMILDKLAPHYGLKVVYKSDASRNVQLYFPWTKDVTASELVDMLNTFERIRLVLDGKNLIVY